jgi:hypothetical protein
MMPGLDKESAMEDLCEFDVEIGRRLWTLLYIWDWYGIFSFPVHFRVLISLQADVIMAWTATHD